MRKEAEESAAVSTAATASGEAAQARRGFSRVAAGVTGWPSRVSASGRSEAQHRIVSRL